MVRKNLSDLLKEEAQKSAEPQEITVEAKLVLEDSASETESDSDSVTNHRRSNPTKAELETTVKELQTALEAAQAENQDLRSQLQEQKTLVEKVEKLQSELDQAKQTILKLTETNSKSNSKPSAKPPVSSALARPIQPTSLPDVPSSAFTDKDLGWFD